MSPMLQDRPTAVQQADRIYALECHVAELKERLAKTTGENLTADLQRLFDLTEREAAVLAILHRRRGAVVSQAALHDLLYGDDIDGGPNVRIIDVFVCKARKKLPAAVSIETVWGSGFRLSVASSAALAARLEDGPDVLRRSPSRSPMPLTAIFRALYDAEVDFGVVSFWDAGWKASVLGPRGTVSETFVDEDLARVGPWLLQTAAALYPERLKP